MLGPLIDNEDSVDAEVKEVDSYVDAPLGIVKVAEDPFVGVNSNFVTKPAVDELKVNILAFAEIVSVALPFALVV